MVRSRLHDDGISDEPGRCGPSLGGVLCSAVPFFFPAHLVSEQQGSFVVVAVSPKTLWLLLLPLYFDIDPLLSLMKGKFHFIRGPGFQ